MHPLWVRLPHWLSAAALGVMVPSGWLIYNASPIYGWLRFPDGLTMGRWLGGGLQWHFAAMWAFGVGTVFYLTTNLATGRWRRQFLPLSPRVVWRELVLALRGQLHHDRTTRYNMLQKLAYLGVIAAQWVALLSGLAIWKSVQFPGLRELMGGYDQARVVHFLAMAVIVGFVLLHLAMVALVPRSLGAMVHVAVRQR